MKKENNIPTPEYREERERKLPRRVQIIQTDGELVRCLEKISRQLDDIASRLPMPASKNPYGAELDKYCDQSAYKRPGTASDGENK